MNLREASKSVTFWIFVALFAGIAFGIAAPEWAKEMDIFSKIFLKLIKTIVAPLLISTLVIGIAGHADMKQVGRMGWKSILYFEVATTIALAFGLIAANTIRPGDGIDLSSVDKSQALVVAKQDWKDIILHIFPENIAKSIAEGQVLQVVIFSIFFAIGLSMVTNQKHKTTMLSFMESVAEVMFKFTKIVMYFAPMGVFGVQRRFFKM